MNSWEICVLEDAFIFFSEIEKKKKMRSPTITTAQVNGCFFFWLMFHEENYTTLLFVAIHLVFFVVAIFRWLCWCLHVYHPLFLMTFFFFLSIYSPLFFLFRVDASKERLQKDSRPKTVRTTTTPNDWKGHRWRERQSCFLLLIYTHPPPLPSFGDVLHKKEKKKRKIETAAKEKNKHSRIARWIRVIKGGRLITKDLLSSRTTNGKLVYAPPMLKKRKRILDSWTGRITKVYRSFVCV